jgi:hypothetical protein
MPSTTAPTKKSPKQGTKQPPEIYTITRILLTLWEMGAKELEIKKGDLTQRLVRKGQSSKDYKEFLDQLQQDQAILIAKNKIAILAKGVDLLGQNLQNPEFEFDSQIGVKTANALLRWMRQMQSTTAVVHKNGKVVESAIDSYKEFKTVALEIYDRLNRDYNMDNLVPIYQIRREIGDRVSRSQFNEWMLEMQTNDILQLIGGEMPSLTPDKAEDSIKTQLGGERYYAKRL